jgi:hypothetical protein
MNLPKISYPIFTTVLPSNNETVHFRPFTVKEEKILLIAEMSEDIADLVLAIKQIIGNCITDETDINSLTIFDLEYLFLQLRSKSIGNIVEFVIQDSEDGKTYELELDIGDVKVKYPENHSNKIVISKELILEMSYPTINDLEYILKFDPNDPVQISEMVARYIKAVYNTETDDMWSLQNYSQQELIDWIDSFDTKAMTAVENFWSTMPKLSHTIQYKNSKADNREIVLEGLRSFFL